MNNTQVIYRMLLALAGLSFLLIFCLVLLGHSGEALWFVWLFFIFLLTGIQGFPHLKSFSFTVWVLAAVVISITKKSTVPLSFNVIGVLFGRAFKLDAVRNNK